MGASQSVSETSIHEFTVKDCRKKDVDLSIYKGKVLLVVNVAQNCIHANTQYTQLTELHKRHRDKGFEILAFPCDQFFRQSPGSSHKAEKFACDRFKAEYPIFRKICVNGSNTAPIFRYLKENSRGDRWCTTIKWNFTKFLVDVDGKVIKRYSHLTAPLDIEEDILNALGERVLY